MFVQATLPCPIALSVFTLFTVFIVFTVFTWSNATTPSLVCALEECPIDFKNKSI